MNVAMLIEKVYQNTSRMAVEDARILELLNEGAEEISRLTTAPTMEVRMSGVTGPFRPNVTLSDGTVVDVDYNGILEAHAHYGNIEGSYQGGGYRVPLRTTSDASRYHPDWRLNKQGISYGNAEWADGRPLQYLIYDPVNLTAELTPMPNPVAATDIYLKLHVRPKPMVERTDVPLNGEFPSYHSAIADYATFILVNQLLTGEEAVTKGQFHYSRFKQLTDRMISAARPEPLFVERETSVFREWY